MKANQDYLSKSTRIDEEIEFSVVKRNKLETAENTKLCDLNGLDISNCHQPSALDTVLKEAKLVSRRSKNVNMYY